MHRVQFAADAAGDDVDDDGAGPHRVQFVESRVAPSTPLRRRRRGRRQVEYASVKKAQRVYSHVGCSPKKPQLGRLDDVPREGFAVHIKKYRQPSPRHDVARTLIVQGSAMATPRLTMLPPWRRLRETMREVLQRELRAWDRDVLYGRNDADADTDTSAVTALVSRVLAIASMSHPRNTALDVLASNTAAQLYSSVGLWEQAQAHAQTALAAVDTVVGASTESSRVSKEEALLRRASYSGGSYPTASSIPRELQSFLPEGAQTDFIPSPEPARARRTQNQLPEACKMNMPSRPATLEAFEGFGTVLNAVCSAITRKLYRAIHGDSDDSDDSTPTSPSPSPHAGNAADVPPSSARSGTRSVSGTSLAVSSTNSSDSASASSDAPQRPVTRSCRDSNPAVPEAVPEALTADAVRALTMQEWLDELFLPDFCEACPWMWMRGVARLLCESETVLSEYPPKERPEAKQPEHPVSWTGIVKVLRQTREVRSTPPGLGIAKNSHSRISFCEEEVFLSDTLGEGFGSDFPSSGWRFSAAVSRTYMSGSLFADIVEEFVAGSSPDVAAMTAILLEQTCTADGFAKVADLCTAFQSQPALANVLQGKRFIDLLQQRQSVLHAVVERALGAEVADALSFTAGTEYISFEEVLCLVSMSKLSVSEWWTVQRTSALTVIGGAALRRQSYQVARERLTSALELHEVNGTVDHPLALTALLCLAEMARIDGEEDAALFQQRSPTGSESTEGSAALRMVRRRRDAHEFAERERLWRETESGFLSRAMAIATDNFGQSNAAAALLTLEYGRMKLRHNLPVDALLAFEDGIRACWSSDVPNPLLRVDDDDAKAAVALLGDDDDNLTDGGSDNDVPNAVSTKSRWVCKQDNGVTRFVDVSGESPVSDRSLPTIDEDDNPKDAESCDAGDEKQRDPLSQVHRLSAGSWQQPGRRSSSSSGRRTSSSGRSSKSSGSDVATSPFQPVDACFTPAPCTSTVTALLLESEARQRMPDVDVTPAQAEKVVRLMLGALTWMESGSRREVDVDDANFDASCRARALTLLGCTGDRAALLAPHDSAKRVGIAALWPRSKPGRRDVAVAYHALAGYCVSAVGTWLSAVSNWGLESQEASLVVDVASPSTTPLATVSAVCSTSLAFLERAVSFMASAGAANAPPVCLVDPTAARAGASVVDGRATTAARPSLEVGVRWVQIGDAFLRVSRLLCRVHNVMSGSRAVPIAVRARNTNDTPLYSLASTSARVSATPDSAVLAVGDELEEPKPMDGVEAELWGAGRTSASSGAAPVVGISSTVTVPSLCDAVMPWILRTRHCYRHAFATFMSYESDLEARARRGLNADSSGNDADGDALRNDDEPAANGGTGFAAAKCARQKSWVNRSNLKKCRDNQALTQDRWESLNALTLAMIEAQSVSMRLFATSPTVGAASQRPVAPAGGPGGVTGSPRRVSGQGDSSKAGGRPKGRVSGSGKGNGKGNGKGRGVVDGVDDHDDSGLSGMCQWVRAPSADGGGMMRRIGYTSPTLDR